MQETIWVKLCLLQQSLSLFDSVLGAFRVRVFLHWRQLGCRDWAALGVFVYGIVGHGDIDRNRSHINKFHLSLAACLD